MLSPLVSPSLTGDGMCQELHSQAPRMDHIHPRCLEGFMDGVLVPWTAVAKPHRQGIYKQQTSITYGPKG